MTATFNPGNEKVLAGIVLYNPDMAKLEANIKALAVQADRILLVDNSPVLNSEISRLQDKYGLAVISNGSNLGVAKGLNQILEYADVHGYRWYLTMDQDSLVADDLIDVFFENADDKTGILCPFLLNNKKITMEEYLKMDLPVRMEITDPIRCITSASLNRTEAALQAGGYLEDLFIDCVDVEFNIRMMEAGWKIVRCPKTWLIQEMGCGKPVRLMEALYRATGKSIFQRLSVTPVYSPERLYYIARNSRWIYQTYREKSGPQMRPSWMLMQFMYYSLTWPSSFSRMAMWKEIARGWKDGPGLGQ